MAGPLSGIFSPFPRAASPGAWLAVVTLLAAAAPVAGPAPRAVAATAAATAAGCARPVAYPHGPFRIASDHRTVLDADGKPFVSYGTTVPGLARADFASDEQSYVAGVVDGEDLPKISATARYWCANTVRLQVSQYDVTQNSTPDNGSCTTRAGQDFLARALDPEARAAEAGQLAVVINDQTGSDPLVAEEKDPTRATFTFWDCVARHRESWGRHRTYAQDPNVIFDMFNEPRADSCTSAHGPYNLTLWRDGGPGPCGRNQPIYQGMEAVADRIRTYDHAANLLWAEGPGFADTLAGLGRGCPPSPNCLITAGLGPVVYAIHHPYLGSASQAKPATWRDEFGYLVDHPAPSLRAPVVVGEWTNIDAADPADTGTASSAYCWPGAPASVPRFLAYLQSIGAGMNAYQLSAGYLLKVNGQWTDTANYTDHPWSDSYCTYIPGRPIPPLLTAGADILTWFRQRNLAGYQRPQGRRAVTAIAANRRVR